MKRNVLAKSIFLFGILFPIRPSIADELSCLRPQIRRVTVDINDPNLGRKSHSKHNSASEQFRQKQNLQLLPNFAQKMDAIEAQSKRLRDHARILAQKEDLSFVENYYLRIKTQIPKGGYYRALHEDEVRYILKSGGLDPGKYFSREGESPHVGHAQNFIFVRCFKCPKEWFKPGNTGGGDVNTQRIPMDRLELIVPELP